MRVNKFVLSDVLGVSEASLSEWQKEDPPLPIAVQAKRRGQSHVYDTSVVIEWLMQRRVRKAGAVSPRDRLYERQAEESALRIAEKRGKLIDVEQLEPMLLDAFTACRARLLEIPDAVVVSLADQQIDTQQVFAVVSELVWSALGELARSDLESGTQPPMAGDEGEPASGHDDPAQGGHDD